MARERDATSVGADTFKLRCAHSPVAMQHSISDNIIELARRKRLGRQASVEFDRSASSIKSSAPSLRRLSLFDADTGKSSLPLEQTYITGKEHCEESPFMNSNALVIYHFQRLIDVSSQFAIAMEFNPDPYSIAVSFCDTYGRMKDVYGDWANVVGDLIHHSFLPVREKLVHSLSQPARKRKLSVTMYSSPKKTTAATSASTGRLKLPDIVSLLLR